mgnify:CR=1 FL=1
MIDLESYIFNWIKTKFDVETPLTANFFEEGVLDSLSFAELIVVLEEHFQIEIDFADITDWEKVSSNITGAVMMRPLVGREIKIKNPASVEQIFNTKSISIYPNPSNNNQEVFIKADNSIKSIKVYD